MPPQALVFSTWKTCHEYCCYVLSVPLCPLVPLAIKRWPKAVAKSTMQAQLQNSAPSGSQINPNTPSVQQHPHTQQSALEDVNEPLVTPLALSWSTDVSACLCGWITNHPTGCPPRLCLGRFPCLPFALLWSRLRTIRAPMSLSPREACVCVNLLSTLL